MLKISRDDIDRYNITEFEASKRFIKLPIANYLKLVPAPSGEGSVFDNLNRPQIALINAINDPKYRFVCAALSRRLGKTFIANMIGQLVFLIPNCNVLIMSPNYTLSSISFELQRKLIRDFDLEVRKDNLKDKIIELENGSTIRMGSISTVDSCVGRSYDLIIFDEAALGADAENAFNISLRPTLDKPNSKAIFISTPRGKLNWFSKFWQRGWSDDPKFSQWVSLQADYTENERMAASDVEEARATMSDAEFQQEYMASFTIFEGQVYRYDEKNTIDYEPVDRAEAFAGLDPGFKDPTALCIIMYKPELDEYHVVDEYQDSQEVTSVHAAKMLELLGKWRCDTVFSDPAAAQFNADLAYMYDIATIKGKKDKLPGIKFVQNLIEKNKIKVAPHCLHTLAMLDQYKWEDGENRKKEDTVHDQFSHMADALRYALYSFVI